jgi:hypothetical protein
VLVALDGICVLHSKNTNVKHQKTDRKVKIKKFFRGSKQSREGPWTLIKNCLAKKNGCFLLDEHLLGYVVYVGDVRPHVGVGVDALRH